MGAQRHHPVVRAVGDDDGAVVADVARIDRHTRGFPEIGERQHRRAGRPRRQLQHPVLGGLGDLQVPRVIDRNILGTVQVGHRYHGLAGRAGGKFQHPVVTAVGDVDVALRIDRDLLGVVETGERQHDLTLRFRLMERELVGDPQECGRGDQYNYPRGGEGQNSAAAKSVWRGAWWGRDRGYGVPLVGDGKLVAGRGNRRRGVDIGEGRAGSYSQFVCRLKAVIRFLRHAPCDHPVEPGRYRGVEAAGFGRLVRAMGGGQPLDTATAKRQPPGEALVEHTGERVHVRAGVYGPSGVEALGGHIRRSSRCDIGERQATGTGLMNESEINQVHKIFADHQQVRRLHIAVHQPGLVRRIQRCGNLFDHPHGLLRTHRPIALENLVQIDAVDDRHHQIQAPVELTGLVDRDDVRAGQPGRRVGLAAKSLLKALLGSQFRLQQLDGHITAQRGVVGPIDRAHTALTELFEKPIATELHFLCRHRPRSIGGGGGGECVMRGSGQLAGRLITVIGVFGHTARDHRVESRRNRRVDFRGFAGGFGRRWTSRTGQALVEHSGQSVDVGADVGGIGASRCGSEIDQVHEGAANQQTRGLYIAVHHPGHVGGFQRRRDLHDYSRRHRRGRWAVAA